MKTRIGLPFFFFLCFTLLPRELISELPVDYQIRMILTTMQYKSNLQGDLKDSFRIGVFHTNSPESREYKEEFTAVFNEQYRNKTIFKMPLALETVSDIEKLKGKSFHVLVIAPGSASLMEKLLEITEKNRMVSVTGVAEYRNLGVTLFVGLNGETHKPYLGINVKSAQRENCVFTVDVLSKASMLPNGN